MLCLVTTGGRIDSLLVGSEPEIAVVIPTRGRETRLAFCLEALAGQSLEASRFEVIVVRDEDAEDRSRPRRKAYWSVS